MPATARILVPLEPLPPLSLAAAWQPNGGLGSRPELFKTPQLSGNLRTSFLNWTTFQSPGQSLAARSMAVVNSPTSRQVPCRTYAGFRQKSVRIAAVRTPATVGPEAVPTLLRVLAADCDRNARRDAADALADLGGGIRHAVRTFVRTLGNALGQSLNDDGEQVRETVREAPYPRRRLPTLREAGAPSRLRCPPDSVCRSQCRTPDTGHRRSSRRRKPRPTGRARPQCAHPT